VRCSIRMQTPMNIRQNVWCWRHFPSPRGHRDPLTNLMTTGATVSLRGTNLFPMAALAATSSLDPVSPCSHSPESDSCAIGGFGFFGPPRRRTGQVEFGYGLVASAGQRCRSLLPRPSVELLEVAAEYGHSRRSGYRHSQSALTTSAQKSWLLKHLTMKPPSTLSRPPSKQQLADSATVASSFAQFRLGCQFSCWLPAGYRIQSDGGTVAA
jgi:hypothetical protein